MKFSIGQPATRLEDQRLLTGSGRYTDDIAAGKDALWASIRRSEVAHANILSINTDDARAMPDVVAVFTANDLESDGVNNNPCLVELDNRDGTKQAQTPWPLLAKDRVRFVGDPVALVIARTKSAADEAAGEIVVDYDNLPAIVDTEDATLASSPDVWEHIDNNVAFDWELGDESATAKALNESHRVLHLRLVNNRVVVNSMEPRPIYATYDAATDRSTLYSSTQGPGFIHAPLTEQILGIEKEKVRCVTNDVGGGFGMKVFVYHEHGLVTWASRRLKTDVRLNPDRSEAFLSDVHGRDHVSYIDVGVDGLGVMQGLRVTTFANMGAYFSNFGPYIPTGSGGHMMPGCYAVPNCYVNVKGVITNTTPVDAYRGAGRPEASYLIERVMDFIAREIDVSPDEIRRRNFIEPQQMPYTTPLGNTYDSGDFDRVMTQALEVSDWKNFSARKEQSSAAGKLRGIGFATYIERCGGGAALPADLRFNDDDTVTVLSGTQSNGQGHETAFAQLLSDRLGIDADRINLVQGDTDRTPGGFTGGSRSVPVGGSAMIGAADEVIAKGKRIAALRLETAEADLEYDDGTFTVAGTDRSLDLFEVARLARDPANLPQGESEGLDTTHSFTPDEATYPNGCHVCELEVDPQTGETQILNYTVVDDFGAVINPLLLEGQVHGGIAQGVGQALLEETVYSEEGQLLSGSFMDYTMPRADTVPEVRFSTENIACLNNPLGIKGAGEAGAIGAPPAVINAVVDAIHDRTGLTHVDMPATPQSIWRLLQV